MNWRQNCRPWPDPGSGPNGGQVYIDGFTGGNLPPKSSIREVRINSNPFSAEYDRPGFGRIEILTKPGTDTFRGQVFAQFNNEMFNTRSPLLQQSSLPPYRQIFYGANVTGPIKKEKASFGFNLEGRTVDENAFILATTLDSNLSPVTLNQGIVTPQMRINISPRLDYTISPRNTLALRYQHSSNEFDKQGVGGIQSGLARLQLHQFRKYRAGYRNRGPEHERSHRNSIPIHAERPEQRRGQYGAVAERAGRVHWRRGADRQFG